MPEAIEGGDCFASLAMTGFSTFCETIKVDSLIFCGYNNYRRIDFDPTKSEKNGRERGLPFERAIEFDWGDATFTEDKRYLYPERRFVAVGYLRNRLHVICFTPIPDGVRVISFRKANVKEARDHGKTITID